MYTAKFNKAIIDVLQHEGHFVNDPTDPGGATNFGISLRWLKSNGDLTVGDIDRDGDIDADDIRKMTVEQATDIYYKLWWVKNKYEDIPDYLLAKKVFDLAVNMGPSQAHKLLQRAVKASGIAIDDDGVLGNQSWSALKVLCSAGHEDALLVGVRCEAAGFYRSLIAKKPQFVKYENGWLKRAYA